MRNIGRAFCILTASLVAMASGLAHAQATRTWVSGVGDDANPCSRTAPCATFAGAISKTATGGEISVLDPGGYGALTINKSITIDGGGGAGFAGILNPGVNGIVVNGAGIIVTLRHLAIDGAGSGLTGIRILNAAKVVIENCQIFWQGGADPNGRGISDQRTGGGQLLVTNTIVRNNNQSGIVIASGGAAIDVTLHGVHMIGNANAGLAATGGAQVTMTHSLASGNASIGVYAEQLAGLTKVFISDSAISDNPTGLFLSSGAPAIRMSNVVITNNDSGVNNVGGGTIFSYSNNRVSGNASGNSPAVVPISPL